MSDNIAWADLKRHPGYQISETGKVRKVSDIPGEYSYIIPKVSKDGTQYLFGKSLQRWVAELFLENELNLPLVSHIDGNRLNNNVSNLVWVDHSSHTMVNKLTDETRYKGKKLYVVETGKIYSSMKQAAHELDVSPATVSAHVLSGKPIRGVTLIRYQEDMNSL